MAKLRKLLTKYTGSILLIILLLVVQAFCDLKLPDYTANIVNIGIQQSGIESPVPEQIRASEMAKIMVFVPAEKDRDQILSYYDLYHKENEIPWDHTVNFSETNDDIILRMRKDAEPDSSGETVSRAIMMVTLCEQDTDQSKVFQQKMREGLPPEMQEAPLIQVFAQMPQEELQQVLDELDQQMKDMPEGIMEQAAVAYNKEEYKTMGIDVLRIQNRYIFNAGLKMLGVAFAAMICTIFVTLLAARVGAGYGRDIRVSIFGRVLKFSNREFDDLSTASLITRSTNDIQQIQVMMIMMLRMIFYAPMMGIGAVLKVTSRGSALAWVLALAVGVILAIVILLFVFVMPKFKLLQKLVDKVNLVAREILTGLPVIRAFSTQKYEENRFDKANDDLTKTNLFVNRVMSIMMPTMFFIMNAISILIVWVGADKIDSGTMQVGDLMATITYSMHVIMSFLFICMLSVMIPRAWVSVRRIGEIFDQPVSIHDAELLQSFDSGKKGWVEFKNVSFRYPNANEDVLSDISFTAKPGETVAFIGSTGSGKSTLVNLIPRFYDVTAGEVLVDGADVRNVSQHDLREKLGYVPQKGVLFSGTIASNIAYGQDTPDQEQVERAAEIAQSTEFIEQKPDRYESGIAQGGGNVSGGQKQRLSIARAIAKNPEIYIFDDSFSALDFKTDAVLRSALKTATKDATILIVAQRISTILNADQILVLDEGRVVGRGTHAELLKSCEVYQQIASSQLSEEELNHAD